MGEAGELSVGPENATNLIQRKLQPKDTKKSGNTIIPGTLSRHWISACTFLRTSGLLCLDRSVKLYFYRMCTNICRCRNHKIPLPSHAQQ